MERLRQNSHRRIALNHTLFCSILNEYVMRQHKTARTEFPGLDKFSILSSRLWSRPGPTYLPCQRTPCGVNLNGSFYWFQILVHILTCCNSRRRVISPSADCFSLFPPPLPAAAAAALFYLAAEPDSSSTTSTETSTTFLDHFFLGINLNR